MVGLTYLLVEFLCMSNNCDRNIAIVIIRIIKKSSDTGIGGGAIFRERMRLKVRKKKKK